MARCAVLYLDRHGNPPNAARAFLTSLSDFEADTEYDFFYLLKGYPAEGTPANHPLNAFKKDVNPAVNIVPLPDDRFALASFLQVARTLPHEKILLFNSWSRIQAPQWLKFYLDAFDTTENCGIVGATGSYERSDYRDNSTPFPNFHIRTNAFLIDRKMFLEMADGQLPEKTSREQECAFEAGPDSLTKQIIGRGLNPVVVDNKGEVWHKEQWSQSRTFRSGYQEGLLVADNRTYDYDTGQHKARRFLADLAWGQGVADVPEQSYYRRLKIKIEWR